MRALISVFDDDGTMIAENKLIDPSSIKYSGDEETYVTKYTFTFEANKVHHFYKRKEDNNGICKEEKDFEE